MERSNTPERGAGTAAAAQRTTLASDDPAVAALGATTGAAVITDANGTIQQYLRGLIAQWATYLTRIPAALGQGTMAQSLRVVLPSDQSSIPVVGPTAIGTGASTNPIYNGFIGRSANPAAGGDTGTVGGLATLIGSQIVKSYSIPEADWSYAAATGGILNTTTAVTIKTAAGAGIRNYVTGIDIVAEALGTATELAIRDGAGGTVLWRTKIGTGGLTGGLHIAFPTPLKGTANTLLEAVTLTASGTGAVYLNAQGYAAP